MTVKFVTNEKVSETSSKGNQEKWFDKSNNRWYKLDQFGYEALSETLISLLLEKSNIENDTPFTFTRYHMEKMNVHGFDRTGCSSENFKKDNQSIITLSHLYSRLLDKSLKSKFELMTSDRKRIQYLAEATSEYTGLKHFPEYLTLLFEVDALFLNDDRHLNNIAIIEENGKYSYCPIFDNGAGLLSNTQFDRFEYEPKSLIKKIKARPFNTTFNRQINTAISLYGNQLYIPKFTVKEIEFALVPLLEYYPIRDRGYIKDRVIACISVRQCVK